MNCAKCQTQNSDDASFCTQCGASLANRSDPRSMKSPESASSTRHKPALSHLSRFALRSPNGVPLKLSPSLKNTVSAGST